jgi:hypothetical protein
MQVNWCGWFVVGLELVRIAANVFEFRTHSNCGECVRISNCASIHPAAFLIFQVFCLYRRTDSGLSFIVFGKEETKNPVKEGDADKVEGPAPEEEAKVHFKPLVALKGVEVVTHEENEDVLFKM